MNEMSGVNEAHLLIVDDDERIRGLLQKFLARNGFWVTAAHITSLARVPNTRPLLTHSRSMIATT